MSTCKCNSYMINSRNYVLKTVVGYSRYRPRGCFRRLSF